LSFLAAHDIVGLRVCGLGDVVVCLFEVGVVGVDDRLDIGLDGLDLGRGLDAHRLVGLDYSLDIVGGLLRLLVGRLDHLLTCLLQGGASCRRVVAIWKDSSIFHSCPDIPGMQVPGLPKMRGVRSWRPIHQWPRSTHR
jgi:hypothetical protein